jgi:RNA-directed DNA polymerase
MLNIKRLKFVERPLRFSSQRLREIADDADSYYEELVLLDPAKPDKPRPVLSASGDLKKVQDRLLRCVLMPKLSPSEYAHGSIPKRHIKTNAQPHANSTFVFTTDISNFFPTISSDRILGLFIQLGCPAEVARILTRLCTYKHHLALGLITSPFLAEQVLLPVDRRIDAVCKSAGLIYTRYVDDITISGPFDFESSGIEASVKQILREHGFTMHPDKSVKDRLSNGVTITSIRVRRGGRLDVSRAFLDELNRQLDDANNLANGREFQGPYYTRDQLMGRVYHACWINPGRRKPLLGKVRLIPWSKHAANGKSLGLFATKKRLVRPRPAPTPQ